LDLQQAEATAKRQAERAEAFVAPIEDAALPVDERRKRKHTGMGGDEGEGGDKIRKKKKHRKLESSS